MQTADVPLPPRAVPPAECEEKWLLSLAAHEGETQADSKEA